LYVGDYMVLISDGYEHAGVGGLYRLGWGWQNIAIAVKRWCRTGSDAAGLARALERTALRLYDNKPGDDTTVVAMKVRPTVRATIWTGPPADRTLDAQATERLIKSEGLKVICGGTTAQIAARVLGKELKVEWVPPRQRPQGRSERKRGAPPTAKLEGIDLVTEGIVTLGQTLELIEVAETVHDLPHEEDAAHRLARILLQADEVDLLVGTAINPAQVADVIRGETMRMVYVRQLIRELERRNKRVRLERI
ncbi:MAG: stage II sporulation protein E, partial [Chloroflexi bacterium]|nr:stage II sporulation protein E [Chloroflexota bacterium]